MSHKKTFFHLLCCGLILSSLLTACNLPFLGNQPTSTPLASPTDVSQQNQTPTPLPEVIDIVVETEPAPTKTAFVPTATVTPVPEIENLLASGPWLVASMTDGIGAMNSDGSALTQISADSESSFQMLKDGVAPTGGILAYVSARDTWYEMTLKTVTLPGDSLSTITQLTSTRTEPTIEDNPAQNPSEALRAMTEENILAWSPDGSQLAFVGAIGGDSSDLYVYSLETNQFIQLTSGATQVVHPVWSPDGKYIVFLGVRSMGDEEGYEQIDVWAADAETGETTWLYKPDASRSETILGWLDDSTFLAYSQSTETAHNLRKVEITGITSEIIWENEFTTAAYDPESMKVLLVFGYTTGADDYQGIFLLDILGDNRTFIDIANAYTAEWIAEAGYFITDTINGYVMLSPKGEYFRMQASDLGELIAAPDGKHLAWFGTGGLLVGAIDKLDSSLPTQVYKNPVISAVWSPDSTSIYFCSLAGLYRIEAPYTEAVLIDPNISTPDLAWVTP